MGVLLQVWYVVLYVLLTVTTQHAIESNAKQSSTNSVTWLSAWSDDCDSGERVHP